jgi:hypothetical protein
MKRITLILAFLFTNLLFLSSQNGNDTTIYLLTCGPGTETYSIYGHSALRIVIPDKKSDKIFNWGVFDFNTTNFAWKFAKGRLEYNVIAQSVDSFLQIYVDEKRYVWSQIINLEPREKAILCALINDNLRPENSKYRYDFFYDDCSTRIRDLLEKSIGGKLLYPPLETAELPSFREMVGKYQAPYPWLHFGIDLIMGSPGDKPAAFRDRMFLPIDMKVGLSKAVINRSGKMVPLLRNPQTIVDFDPPVVKANFLTSPAVIFTGLLIIVLIISARLKSRKENKLFDIAIFSVYSILAILMIFFNFFTDHQQMKMNLNIIWLNPIILICLVSLFTTTGGKLWFRIVFYISVVFLIFHLLLPQSFGLAILPLVLILLIRSSIRGDFDWNPIEIE